MLELGVVVRAHGVRGAVGVRLHNPASTALRSVAEVFLERGGTTQRLRCRQVGGSGELALLVLEGVSDRGGAEALRGARVLVERAALPPLEPDQYYYQDLIGCLAEDEQGRPLGEVAEVFSAGASDVLVVRDADSERLIPLVDQWVTEVDLEARRIRVQGADQFEPTRR